MRCLAARLVVILTRTNLADLLANVVRKLEALGGNQTLPLDLSRLAVVLRLRGSLLALGSQVSRVDVAVGEENGHAVLRLAARQLELLDESAETRLLLLDVLSARVVRSWRERLRLVGDDRLGRRGLLGGHDDRVRPRRSNTGDWLQRCWRHKRRRKPDDLHLAFVHLAEHRPLPLHHLNLHHHFPLLSGS